jgi:hypothetical protein
VTNFDIPTKRPRVAVVGHLCADVLTGDHEGTAASHSLGEAARANRRAGLAAFGWVVVFVAWHVVWYLTGLVFPTSSHVHGSARVAYTVATILTDLMWVIGCILPLALVQPWGRRIPLWMRLTAAWLATGVLAARGLSGILDDLLRAFGSSHGLTGLTAAQTAGTTHITFWVQFSGVTTDLLFTAGAVAFGTAALAHRRSAPSRPIAADCLGGAGNRSQ